jgi:hypothetical protein
MDDAGPSGGTELDSTARDPDLPRTDDPIRGAQEQDDSSKATAGVTWPGGTKLEGSTDGDQWSATLTVPFGGGGSKPVDTAPSATNPDAPADSGACTGDDGQSYPNGWVLFRTTRQWQRAWTECGSRRRRRPMRHSPATFRCHPETRTLQPCERRARRSIGLGRGPLHHRQVKIPDPLIAAVAARHGLRSSTTTPTTR